MSRVAIDAGGFPLFSNLQRRLDPNEKAAQGSKAFRGL
jgi:hypothetical protein